ncbi:hypothetical protein WA026_001467 [Henosepilachna vigintioctopunctata]|uniref:Sulfotransferase domain-containing protein n=1 Tax=Henosepilachna vigintioctopunctata TaxID=420089 RepID=A0AAW1UKN3_9CUCU
MLKTENKIRGVFGQCIKEKSYKKNEYPYEIRKLEDSINKKLLEDFSGERTGFVQIGKKKWFFPSGMAKQAEDFYNFEVRPSDIWIVTFPRSGTTLTQEMIWLLANNLDYEKASRIPLTARYPFLEFSCFVHPETKAEFIEENKHSNLLTDLVEKISEPLCDQLSQIKERRFLKTHLPLSLLPRDLLKAGCKVIYVARNPKDVAVSFYHLNRLIRTQGYKGDFPTYWRYFTQNLQPWAPYWEHILEAWNVRHEENLLFMFYEDMIKVEDLNGSIRKVQNFLGTKYTDAEINTLEKHLQIDNFRMNKSVNFDILKKLGILKSGEEDFVRKGKNGDWKNHFDQELNKEADEWIEDNLKYTDLKFPTQ